jgi:hypothetical protein
MLIRHKGITIYYDVGDTLPTLGIDVGTRALRDDGVKSEWNGSNWIDGWGSETIIKWGNIEGNLSDQIDLVAEFAEKAPLSHTHRIQDIRLLEVALDYKQNYLGLGTGGQVLATRNDLSGTEWITLDNIISGGDAVWGSITGDIELQIDMQNEFVNADGDTMTGDLTSPNFIITGSSPSHNMDGIVSDHNSLSGRDAADTHPIASITDLFDTVFFTNTEPTSVEHGGIPAGSTFDEVAVTEMFNKILYPYQTPSFATFAIDDAGAMEVGDSVSSGNHNFTWTVNHNSNIVPDTISIYDATDSISLGSDMANDGSEVLPLPFEVTYSSMANHTWRIAAENSRGDIFTKDSVVSWQWRNFWGNDADGSITGEDIVAGSNRLSTTGDGDYTAPSGSNVYKWLAFPEEYGTAGRIIDPKTEFDIAMDPSWNPRVVSISNLQGVVVDMNVYRTMNRTSATLTMRVSGVGRDARAPVPGTIPLSGKIAPLDAADSYPVTEETYNQGGYRSVATLIDRDTIPELRKKAGMLVYVEETELRYRLEQDMVSWYEDTFDRDTYYEEIYLNQNRDDSTEFQLTAKNFIIMGSTPSHGEPDEGVCEVREVTWNELLTMNGGGLVKIWDRFIITDRGRAPLEIYQVDTTGEFWYNWTEPTGAQALLKLPKITAKTKTTAKTKVDGLSPLMRSRFNNN